VNLVATLKPSLRQSSFIPIQLTSQISALHLCGQFTFFSSIFVDCPLPLQLTTWHTCLQFVFPCFAWATVQITHSLCNQVPDLIGDTYKNIFGKALSALILTHLKWELIHTIWELLMDEEFMHVYEHGIIIRCADGIIWCVFPRFFTYGADYPEKYILITSVKSIFDIYVF